jgi:GntR family transcriptional regulator, transcriptional repressor for pyruvate dehydrogenase complex
MDLSRGLRPSSPGGTVSNLADREAALGAAQNYVSQIVRAPKTAELIAALYRRQIVRGELRPGDTLPPEQQLMARFGVSRPTLREAFRILETENLISVKRGSRGGARVTQPSVSVAARYVGLLLQVQATTIADVYEARIILESACARLLARRRSTQDLIDLSACVDELRGVVEAGPAEVPEAGRWSGLAYRFHNLIVQRCGNQTLAVQGGIIQEIVETHLTLTVTREFREQENIGQSRRNVRSYRKLVSLVDKRDGSGAEKHWRTHLQAANKRLLRDDIQNLPVLDLFA